MQARRDWCNGFLREQPAALFANKNVNISCVNSVSLPMSFSVLKNQNMKAPVI